MASSCRETDKNNFVCPKNLSVSDLKSNGLAGFCAFIWSNLCTRYIREQLTPRGHHDWPDKRATRGIGLLEERYSVISEATRTLRWRSAGRVHALVRSHRPASGQGRTRALVTVRRTRPSPLQRAGDPLQSAAATLASIQSQLEGHIDHSSRRRRLAIGLMLVSPWGILVDRLSAQRSSPPLSLGPRFQ